MIPSSPVLFRLQASAWAALLVLCLGLLAHAILLDQEVPFIRQAGGPQWIMAPPPETTNLIVVNPAAPPAYVFTREFEAGPEDSTGRLRGAALKNIRLRLNGEPVALTARGNGWKQGFEADLGGRLRAGRNRLTASVTHPNGPALLQLELEKPSGAIVTDQAWRVAGPGNGAVAAQVATDIALHPGSQKLPASWEIPKSQGALLFLAFVGGAGIAWRRSRLGLGSGSTNAPAWTLASITCFWVATFALKFWRIPVGIGFDAPAHLVYIDFLLDFGALPTAAYGFSTYHPPLFYVMTSAFVGLLGTESASIAGQVAYRLLPFASGLAGVWLTAWVAGRLWPGEALRPSLAIAIAGLLPMNLYMSAYVSNEPLLAALISGALALATAILLAERVRWVGLACLTLLLGAALLTKFTALAVAPIIAFFVALRAWWLDDHGPGRALAWLVGLVAGAALISGWFYTRNWLLFGDPLVWNLDVPGAPTWWMRPGFHTADWYLRFGEALSHPLFAGYASFWDGVYSTLWGDGLVGGMVSADTRHGLWNDQFQWLTYPLALPATLAMVAGFARLWVRSLRDESPARRLVLSMLVTVLFVLSFSLGLISLQLAFYAQAKAFYLLCAGLPLAIVGAEGLGAATAWSARGTGLGRRTLHCLWVGWMAALGTCIVAAHLG